MKRTVLVRAHEAQPIARLDPEDLEGFNARVRRLGNAYAKKYRPVFFPLAYHTRISEGRTIIKLDTIVKESARYTDNGKPLGESTVQRLLAEMKKQGALRTEPRRTEDDRRQTSSYRYLDFNVAMNRYGYTVPHDFAAPLEGSGSQSSGSQDVVTTRLQVSETQVRPELSVELAIELSPEDQELGKTEEDQNQDQNQAPAGPDGDAP
jgi:hypothetical protein